MTPLIHPPSVGWMSVSLDGSERSVWNWVGSWNRDRNREDRLWPANSASAIRVLDRKSSAGRGNKIGFTTTPWTASTTPCLTLSQRLLNRAKRSIHAFFLLWHYEMVSSRDIERKFVKFHSLKFKPDFLELEQNLDQFFRCIFPGKPEDRTITMDFFHFQF